MSSIPIDQQTMVPSIIEEQIDRMSRNQHQHGRLSSSTTTTTARQAAEVSTSGRGGRGGRGSRRSDRGGGSGSGSSSMHDNFHNRTSSSNRRHDNALFMDSVDDDEFFDGNSSTASSSLSASFNSSMNRSTSNISNKARCNPDNIYEQYRHKSARCDRQLYLWDKLAMRGSPPDTPPQELAKRATFMLICMMKLGACTIWGAMFWFLNEPYAALCPVTYYVCVSGSMSTLAFEGKYDNFVIMQLALIFLLPFAVHIVLGGLVESGGVLLWSFLAPLGAAFFRSSKESVVWYQTFVLSSVVLIGYDFYEALYLKTYGNENPRHAEDLISMFYFTMNIMGVLTIVFAAAQFFAAALEDEFGRSESLLHNTLPPSIARRIHTGENPIIDKYAEVSILFADVVGFTKATSDLSPKIIIEGFLKDFFRLTDKAVENRGLTKIKTIGDAYMVVGGVEEGGPENHAAEMLRLAGDIFDIIEAVNYNCGTTFQVRIGIHQGPVIAGVLGVKRFSFDVWGDAVNMASRMESHGRPAYVHLTEEAYNATRFDCDGEFDFNLDGEMEVKGKGKMTTYFAKPSFRGLEASGFFDLIEDEYREESKDCIDSEPRRTRNKRGLVFKKLLKRLKPTLRTGDDNDDSEGREFVNDEHFYSAALALSGPFASTAKRIAGSRNPEYYKKLLQHQTSSSTSASRPRSASRNLTSKPRKNSRLDRQLSNR